MGIFANHPAVKDLFTTYRVTLEFRDKIMGGVPMNPKMIEGWLRAGAGIKGDEEILKATEQTLRELGAELKDGATWDDMVEASKLLALELHTNCFKRDADGLYIEGRQIKAMLKENVSINYTGTVLNLYQKKNRSGQMEDKGKAARSAVAERVHVAEAIVHLGRKEPDGTDLFIGHTTGPKGPQSNLTYYQHAEKPRITFTVQEIKPCLSEDQWAVVWESAQVNGLGALRSQGFGRFDIVEWTPQ